MKRTFIAITLACVLCGTALAGETPGVPRSVVGELPTVPSTKTPPVPGEKPGVRSASYRGNGESLITTALLTIISTLIGR